MRTLPKAVADYLGLRRNLGFKLHRYEAQLRQFLLFLKERRTSRITTKLALEFATHGPQISPKTALNRLAVVRGFARYRRSTDPSVEIPPCGLLPGKTERPRPYLYSQAEIDRLLQGAKDYPCWTRFPGPCWSRFQAWTFYCIFGLLVVTGMRVGEVLNLQAADIDWGGAVLTIRNAKFGKSRLVPLHPSTLKALATFVKHRDCFLAQLRPQPVPSHFFVTSRGTRLAITHVEQVFVCISRQIGLRGPKANRGPRLHDFRHRFAIQTLLRWYRRGQPVDPLLPVLATYLGHTRLSGTYWYLDCTPELMAAAAQRLERRWKGVR